MNTLSVISIICVITGLLLKYMVGRRKFSRRNVTGIERFRSYNQMILIRAFENIMNTLAKLLLTSAIILFILSRCT